VLAQYPYNFETIICPLCNSDKYERHLRAPDRFHLAAGNLFEIVRCVTCGFIYLNPRPRIECLPEFYQDKNYQPFLSAQSGKSWWDRIYNLARSYAVCGKRVKIEKLKRKGQLLDIGCGTGEFLNEMQKHGWQATGIEKDPRAAEVARQRYGLDVLTTDLTSSHFAQNSFDVITFWHVLEHLPDPLHTLQRAKKMLKEDGLMLVAAPNISSYDARFYRSRWAALDAPRHLHHFVPATLARLCQAAGLEMFTARQMVLDAFYNCLMSERIIASIDTYKEFFLPLFLLRGFGVAGISLLLSRLGNGGSSILYFIKKLEN
jgi:2-polyprenyl-3-methyl-5-hydroxy-6-metoxy-1,4-benzoquinol methylase